VVPSSIEINLSLTNPALTKAFTKVDAKFCRAESTLPLVKPGPKMKKVIQYYEFLKIYI